MGCDIHTFVEVRRGGRWCYEHDRSPFDVRHYGVFGFLADVRNYSHSPVIAKPRGLPADITVETRTWWQDHAPDGHTPSYLTVAELRAYDYDQVFWDRRVTKDGNGAALADEGEGKNRTVRDFLGASFFDDLDAISRLGDPADVRVVLWFDS